MWLELASGRSASSRSGACGTAPAIAALALMAGLVAACGPPSGGGAAGARAAVTEDTASGRGGDYAWEAGSAFETGTDSDGAAHTDSGKYLWVWRRGHAGWRIVAHSFSLDAGSAPDAE